MGAQTASGPVLTPTQMQAAGHAPRSRLDNLPLPANYGQPYHVAANDQYAWQWSTAPLSSGNRARERSGVTGPAPMAGQKLTTKIALLVPLTGRNAALGQSLLNAAQLAVFDYAEGDFELMPRDTGDSAQGAVAALRDAQASGARLVVGPLFSASVAAIKPYAQNANLPVLALSNDADAAGQNVYVLGLSPVDQVARVVGYAASRDIRSFAALVPASAYGRLAESSFREAVKRAGGHLAKVERYASSANVVKHLDAVMAAMPEGGALLIADGGLDLRTIASQFSSSTFDAHKIKLLGTGLWDDQELGRNAPALMGGWYAAPNPNLRRSFVNAYRNTYGNEPPRVAALAYDATAFAAQVSRSRRGLGASSFGAGATFAGIDGTLRLTRTNTAERTLAVMEVEQSGTRLVSDSAPAFDD